MNDAPKAGFNSNGQPGWNIRIAEDGNEFSVYRSLGGTWNRIAPHKSISEARQWVSIFEAITSPATNPTNENQ